ncbi:MAG: TolC family protein [Gammaproteobacteria bacterium]|nr:TolC family protein [Gammaproteobacteria bacterium]
MLRPRVPSPLLVATFSLLLGACASVPEGRGVPEVRALTAARGAEVPAAEQVSTLAQQELAKPLTLQRAVQLALRNNPQVQTEFARLGLAAADVYDAGRLANPQFSAAVMTPDATGNVNQVSFGIGQRISDLLLLPARRRLASGELERAQADAAQAIVNLAADVEAAWYAVRGAEEIATLRAEQARAATTAAALSQRLFEAGNVSARDLAQAQAEASGEQLTAGALASELKQARTQLIWLMGLGPEQANWHTEGDLALPEAAAPDIAAIETEALEKRLDLASRRRAVALLEDGLKEAHRWRYLGEVSVGLETERQTDRSRLTGPNLAIELPVFNHGDGRLARAESQLALAQSSVRSLELEVRRDVRAAAERVISAQQRGKALADTLIPAREAVYARTKEEVNYMLQSPFELIRARQQWLEARQQQLEAARDYWLARASLSRAIGARQAAPETAP